MNSAVPLTRQEVATPNGTLMRAEPYQLGRWCVDPGACRISDAAHTGRIEPRAMAVLTYLAVHHGRTVSRDELLDEIWRTRHVVEEALTKCISQLRRVLQDSPRDPIYIETVHKLGYRLIVTPAPIARQSLQSSLRADHYSSHEGAAIEPRIARHKDKDTENAAVLPCANDAVLAPQAPAGLREQPGERASSGRRWLPLVYGVAAIATVAAGCIAVSILAQPASAQNPVKLSPSLAKGTGLVELQVAVEGSPSIGDTNAPVVIVEFTDYQCSACARHSRETLPEIERDYIRTGKVKYVVRDFPVTSIHPLAEKAHEAARCAGEQGQYWQMHDRLFASAQPTGTQALSAHARALSLNLASFERCEASAKYAEAVRKDVAEGNTAGIAGTPSFLLGWTDPKSGKVTVRRRVGGAQPYARFKLEIEDLLAAPRQ